VEEEGTTKERIQIEYVVIAEEEGGGGEILARQAVVVGGGGSIAVFVFLSTLPK